jgi:hypothetical protein
MAPVCRGAARAAVQGVVARGEDRQPAAQAGELQADGGRRAGRRHDREPPPVAAQAVARLDDRAEAAGVDEAHLAEVDEQRVGGPARRIRERGAEVVQRRDVELALGGDDGHPRRHQTRRIPRRLSSKP